jgi:signal transduction histidine kinase/CheY-like chemotaxis protein/HPt (histidine-containing phosphotransfer) domain-containing protein
MLKIRGFRSLRAQSFIVVLLCGLLMACLFMFYALPEQARWVNDGLSKAAQRSLAQLSTSITTPLLTRQYAELYEEIDSQLQTRPNWKSIKIVDVDSKNQLYPLENWVGANENGDMLLSQQVVFLDKPLANISLVVNFTNEINESSKLHYTLIYIQFIILVIVFIGLAWLVDYRVTSPLRTLKLGFSRLAKGDFDCHIDKQQQNEVGSVINAFNNMVDEVANNHQKLNALRIQAESASKAKSDFMASMSHELRTPLNAILGLAQLYGYDENANKVQKENAKSIYQAGEHLLLLIDDVLDLTAIESGNMQFSFSYVPIKSILEESVELVTELIKGQSITLQTHGFESLEGLSIYIDQRRFKQVMLNLLSNAIKYNKPNGSININCRVLSNKQCEIDVIDTGCGFAPDDISRLFKPFDRLGAETSKVNGTGIGLVITKQLVERMQGSLSAQSEQHKGSCFTLNFNSFDQTDLPAQVQAPQITQQSLNAVTLPTLEVLVAEDQVTNQQVLKQQLTMLGVCSTFVSNGEQAWEAIQNKRFDILLTDIQMPLLDGLGLAKKIRENTHFDELIIIAITANITKNNIDNCYTCGMNGFLTKPIELVKLKSLLMEHSQTMVNTRSEKSDGENIASDSFDQLDITLLKAMLGDDPSVHCMVFNAFLQTAGEQIKLANAYAKSKNYVDLAFQAHALKSSSKSVGAIELANICQQIETQAESEIVKGDYIQQLEECFNDVVTQLKSYCLRYEKRT